MTDRLQVFGATPSPYTLKLLALLRFKHIPYSIHWGDITSNLKKFNLEPAKPSLLPSVIMDSNHSKSVSTDTTPIIENLEITNPLRPVLPTHSVLKFLNYILEDFGDEWMTKYMFHYRWHFQKDADNAEILLPLTNYINISDEDLHTFGKFISSRQKERLWVVGSNKETAKLIEQSYIELLECLEKHFKQHSFLLGNFPSSSDFAFFGQLQQLINFDPTPRALAHKYSMRTVAWINNLHDLSGYDIDDRNEIYDNDIMLSLNMLFQEISKLYVPCMVANHQACKSGDETWEIEINGSTWKQKSFKYQFKCIEWIRERFQQLSSDDQKIIRDFFENTNCHDLIKV